MNKDVAQISNPFSTGGGGDRFEKNVQAAFAVLMLAQGFSPCLPAWPIIKIKVQGKYADFNTDDFIVFVKETKGSREAKLLAQVKHNIQITKGSNLFGEVIRAAWKDYNNKYLFNEGKDKDAIALITGPINSTDIEARNMLDMARYSEDANDFFRKMETANFVSDTQREKLDAFREHLKNANNGTELSDDQLWKFFKSYHLLSYDLDIRAGVTHSLLHSLIGQYSPDNARLVWAGIVEEVRSANPISGTVTIESFTDEIRSAFQQRAAKTIPVALSQAQPVSAVIDWRQAPYPSELANAVLIGAWNEKNTQDTQVVSQITNENYENFIKKLRGIYLVG